MGKLIRFVIVVLLLSMACVDPVRDSNLDQLHANLALWRKKSTDSYRFKFTDRCSHIRDYAGPYLVLVTNGIVDSVYNTFENPELPDLGEEFAGNAIEQHFLWSECELNKSYDNVDVRYDSLLGYPRYVCFDFIESIADEERRSEIDSVVFIE